MEGLDCLLGHLELTSEQMASVFGGLLVCLERFVFPDQTESEKKRFNLPKAAMRCLANNLGRFSGEDVGGEDEGSLTTEEVSARLARSLVLEHARRVWTLLHPLSQHHNTDVLAVAMDTMRHFLGTLARQLAAAEACGPPRSDAAREHYFFFIRQIQQIVTQATTRSQRDAASKGAAPELPVSAMARAFRLLGEFAAPMARFEGVAKLQEQLADMCRYTRDYLLPAAARYSEETRVSVMRSLGHLPVFIEAFANVTAQASSPAVHARRPHALPRSRVPQSPTCAASVSGYSSRAARRDARAASHPRRRGSARSPRGAE